MINLHFSINLNLTKLAFDIVLIIFDHFCQLAAILNISLPRLVYFFSNLTSFFRELELNVEMGVMSGWAGMNPS